MRCEVGSFGEGEVLRPAETLVENRQLLGGVDGPGLSDLLAVPPLLVLCTGCNEEIIINEHLYRRFLGLKKKIKEIKK